MTSDERWQRYFQIRDGVLTGKTAHDIAYYHMQALCNKLLAELDRLDGTNAARCAAQNNESPFEMERPQRMVYQHGIDSEPTYWVSRADHDKMNSINNEVWRQAERLRTERDALNAKLDAVMLALDPGEEPNDHQFAFNLYPTRDFKMAHEAWESRVALQSSIRTIIHPTAVATSGNAADHPMPV